VGLPCGKLQDGVKIMVCHYSEYDESRAVEITVHAPAVLKLWGEHELNDDISLRESWLHRADMLEAEAKKIREEWGWS